ncbi:MAG: hypothetical protein U1F21_14585 [Sphaerotilus natans]
MSEGMGGWFWFGWRNRMLHAAQRLGDFSTALATSVLSFTPALQQDVERSPAAGASGNPLHRADRRALEGQPDAVGSPAQLPDTVPFRTPIVTLARASACPTAAPRSTTSSGAPTCWANSTRTRTFRPAPSPRHPHREAEQVEVD